jgi:hypothetical protein
VVLEAEAEAEQDQMELAPQALLEQLAPPALLPVRQLIAEQVAEDLEDL